MVRIIHWILKLRNKRLIGHCRVLFRIIYILVVQHFYGKGRSPIASRLLVARGKITVRGLPLCFNTICEWFIANSLSLNLNKTHYMQFKGTSKPLTNTITIRDDIQITIWVKLKLIVHTHTHTHTHIYMIFFTGKTMLSTSKIEYGLLYIDIY